MDWFEPIAAYCERAGAGFWAEPVNALSNAAFLVAAVAAARRAAAGPRHDPACLVLAGIVAAVGIGSFLFHTLAVRWSMLADVVPIALLIHAYFWLAVRRLLGLGVMAANAATLAFAALGFGLGPAVEALAGASVAAATNGSLDYLPALLALAGVALAVRAGPGDPARNRAASARLAAITALFLTSLVLRTVDRGVCDALPTGTHALWHVLNAGVLYGLIAVLLDHRAGWAPEIAEASPGAPGLLRDPANPGRRAPS